MKEENRGPWYLFTGLILGVVLGIVFAWVLNPVQFIDTAPDSLRPEFKEQYRSMVALSYQADGDLGRARRRIGLLQDSALAAELAGQAERLKQDAGDNSEVRALNKLSMDLQKLQTGAESAQPATSANQTTPQGTAQDPTATVAQEEMIQTATQMPPTPRPTFTARPTLTPHANLDAPFELKDRQKVCESNAQPGLLQVEAQDKDGKPVAGVRITVTWNGGSDSFFTGLYPKISSGYADFALDSGKVYSVQVGDGGKAVTDIQAETCDGGVLAALKLTFSQ
jgi:hypothetical protein